MFGKRLILTCLFVTLSRCDKANVFLKKKGDGKISLIQYFEWILNLINYSALLRRFATANSPDKTGRTAAGVGTTP